MVLLCGDGSIVPLNLQRTIISGGLEGDWTNGVLLTCRCKAICSEGLVVLGGGIVVSLGHVHVVHGCPEIVRAACQLHLQ